MYKFSKRSEKNLIGVHPDLVSVAKKALSISQQDFAVICGVRTVEEQKMLVKLGKSKTMNSRHLTGHAIDVVPVLDGGKISWESRYFFSIADAFFSAGIALEVRVEWGGEWKSFVDFPHFQLPWKDYPKEEDEDDPEPELVF